MNCIIKYINSRSSFERLGVFVSTIFCLCYTLCFLVEIKSSKFDWVLIPIFIGVVFFSFFIPYALFWGINWIIKGWK